jgi:ribonuclease I
LVVILSRETVPSTVIAMESGPEESAPELLLLYRAGAVLRTRDRRAARIHHAEPAAGLIHGEVEMHGACVWRADGRYRDAAFGAPGPLDLMPPESVAPPATGPQRISLEEALATEHRLFCCD